jgi:hypothetical protein
MNGLIMESFTCGSQEKTGGNMSNMIFQARLAISGPWEAGEHKRYIVGGALIGHADMPVTKSGNWEMIECEVIIKPTKIYRKCKDSLKNARVDHMAQSLGDLKNWSECEDMTEDYLDNIFN